MLKRSKFLRRLLRVLAVTVLLFGLFFAYLVWVSDIPAPKIKDTAALQLQRQQPDSGLYTINNSWFRKSNSGLYELYAEGTPFERGVINGKLSKELVQLQEDYFSAQINKLVPSKFYRHFLKYFIGFFNRKLPDYVTEEYKEEIYGVSRSASDNYGYIGDKYQRILNYHSAHDIGHALQNLALVGCTSFGTWGTASEDSSLIIGRNFDFYVGDDFAKNKIVAFINPSSGYKFMSVTWGGFTGVVSGMNEKGLTVTINAAKSSYPTGAATPVSLVAREIVQYAQNIREALAIAGKRKMFVSESFLVGSAADGKAVIIEKTPDSLAVYDPGKNAIQCTNHFQSAEFWNSAPNREMRDKSSSVYRYNRLNQLLTQNGKNSVQKTIAVLRDYKGINNADIGLGNEKAVNQFIAHHSIVFEPQKLLVWVSTSPWQLGPFVCYDLNKVFSLQGMKTNREINEPQLAFPADPFIYTPQFKHFEQFRNYQAKVRDGETINPDSLVAENPTFYNSYILAGDYCFKKKEYSKAARFYQKSLTLEIANHGEQEHARSQLKKALHKTEN
ncbi:C45 family autoproteolytic acyltransferase/hydolase [Niabella beijingensis]|uniref:C45 family autoproteolytic acyltransferase/hydolase n=1 Tax=Niabella beijingensis TaxID=2872700 RepID=UPI001CBC8720|nr:C45 family peptidase [Niabella beijingensis]MBZ4188763.1 C45 family peptidase [Niabella beijingensis]